MQKLEFTQDSEAHGFNHEARVLLYSLVIANELNVPLRDRNILGTAAIYHDTQRVNDIDDPTHGRLAKEYYCASVPNPDSLVAFLCEYHCLPDEEGYQKIMSDRKLGKSRSRAKLLIDIFKDADALDRVRFGIRDLDLNQLRLPISKELGLFARLSCENIKIDGRPKMRKPSLEAQIRSGTSRSKDSDINNTLSQKEKRYER